MGKLIRFVLFLFVGLMALLVITAVAVRFLVDPNDFRDDITRVVHEQTGRTLKLKGDLGLSVFPWLGLEMGAARLSNARGFSADTFAEINHAQLRVKVLPLLKKRIEMDTLILDGLVLNLEKDVQGRTNWDDLTGADEAQAQPEAAEQPQAGGPAMGGFTIGGMGGLQIDKARIVWDDRTSTDARYIVSPFSLKTGSIAPGEPVAVDMELHMVGIKPAIKADVQFSGELAVSETFQQVNVKDADLSLGVSGENVPGGGRFETQVKSDVALDLDAQTLSAEKLVVMVLGVALEGRLSGEKILEDTRAVSGDIKVRPFSPRELAGKLTGAEPETSDASVLNQADAQARFQYADNSVALDDLVMHLDDTTLQGRLNVADLETQAIRFDLGVDEIDLDRYLPPATGDGAAPEAPAPAGAAASELPLDALRSLNLEGTLKIDSLKAYQLRSRNVQVTVSAADGKLRVNPAKADLYDGGYSGDVRLEVRGNGLRVSMDENLSKVNVGALLTDMTGKDTVTGTLSAVAKLSGTGDNPDAIKKALNGNLALSFSDGAVKGVNLVRVVRQAQAVVKGKPYVEKSEVEQTDFSTLTATASVADGVVRNNDLEAKSPLLRIQGKGSVNLGKESIDYLLTTTIVGTLEGQGGRELSDLKGIPIPIEVNGTFSKPRYEPRLDEALKQVAGEKVKEKVEEEKEKLREKAEKKLQKKLGKELGDGLKGLFH